jgi:signal transduction histidine kinase
MTASARKSASVAASDVDEVDTLRDKIRSLEAHIEGLEKEMVQRGIKLNCANIALARAKIAFDQSAERREAMVLEVSHDLRTPLTSIKGAAQNLLDGVAGPLTADQREYLDIVRDHAERLIGSVNWLVDAIRATASPIELVAKPVDLSALASAVVHGLGPLAAEAQLDVRVEGEASHASLDEVRFRKVIENLVGNALKFTPAGGTVIVRTFERDGRAWLCVRDTGPGLSPEQAERVFDRFYRGHSSAEGSGVGLAICREIVRAHGGDLTVTSGQEQGSEFQAWVPLDPTVC